MRRREFIMVFFGGAAASWPLAAHAEPATNVTQIGMLSLGRGGKSDANLTTIDAFIPAMRTARFVEGQNIALSASSAMAT